MQILYIGNVNSIHYKRIKKSLLNRFDIIDALSFPYTESYFNKFISLIISFKSLFTIKYDVIHIHYLGYLSIFPIFFFPDKCVLTIYGSEILYLNKKGIRKLIILELLKRVKYITLPTKVMLSQANEIYIRDYILLPLGLPVNNFSVHKNIKDLEIFVKLKFNKLVNYRINNSPKIILGSARALKYIYGLDIAIKSIFILKNKGFNIELRIAGCGVEFVNLSHMIQKLNLSENIIFYGNLNEDEMKYFYSEIDIYLCPSRSESYGVSVLEASSFGLPIIASDVGGLPELIENNINGFLVEVNNEIAISNCIQHIVNDLSYDNYRNICINAYHNVLNNHSFDNATLSFQKIYSNFIY